MGASFAPTPSGKGQNSRIRIDEDTPKQPLPTLIPVKGVKEGGRGVMARKAICLRGRIEILVAAQGYRVVTPTATCFGVILFP